MQGVAHSSAWFQSESLLPFVVNGVQHPRSETLLIAWAKSVP